MSNVPIPKRKPAFTTPAGGLDNFYGTVKDLANGVFSFGLDYLGDKLAFEKQLQLMKYQSDISQANEATNTGMGAYPQMQQSYAPASNFNLGGVSPMTLALLGLAALILLKK